MAVKVDQAGKGCCVRLASDFPPLGAPSSNKILQKRPSYKKRKTELPWLEVGRAGDGAEGGLVFSIESALCTKWPKYWSFSFSISPSNEY